MNNTEMLDQGKKDFTEFLESVEILEQNLESRSFRLVLHNREQ